MNIDEPHTAANTTSTGNTSALDAGLTTADLAASPNRGDGPSDVRSLGEGQPVEVRPRDQAQGSTPLFPAEETGALRGRWDEIQAGFVDEPRRAVEQADNLVAGAMKRLAETFAAERGKLEGQWDRGDDVSTEDLRLALQRYRSFFGRLLAI